MSCLHMFCSLFVLAVAILTGVVYHISSIPSDIHIQIDTANTDSLLIGNSIPKSLSQQHIKQYRTNGVLFVKQLLSEEEAAQLKQAANYASSQMLDIFGLFGSNSRYSKIMFDLWRINEGIATLVLKGLPKIVSQIMMTTNNVTSTTESGDVSSTTNTTMSDEANKIRLLRDAFFAYTPPGEGCGWHVDDVGFWPTKETHNGPTVWIALDSLRVKEGGGLAVLNRTNFQLLEPLNVTEEYCRNAIVGATCDMPIKAIECHNKMERSKLEYDMEPGDAIIWDRWTFHRGVGGTEFMPSNVIKQRYSIRYIPQGSIAYGAVHKSVEQNTEIKDSPYYPQVWPNLIEAEMKALEHGLDADISLIAAISFMSKRMMNQFKSYFFSKDNEDN